MTRIADELAESKELEAEALEHQALGAVERIGNRFTLAIEHYERALELHQSLKDHRGQARDHNALGAAFSIVGNFPTALEHLHAAYGIYEEFDDRPAMAQALHNIGQTHRNTGDYPSALEFEHRALSMFEDLGDLSGVARVTSSIGSSHGDSGNRTDAISHYERALKIYDGLGEQRGVAQVIGNIGTLHIDSDNYDEGLKDYSRALEIAEELGDQGAMAQWMINIAFVLLDTGRLEEARTLIERFSQLSIIDPRVRIIRYNLTGHLLEAEGELDDAKSSYEHALDEATKFSLRGGKPATFTSRFETLPKNARISPATSSTTMPVPNSLTRSKARKLRSRWSCSRSSERSRPLSRNVSVRGRCCIQRCRNTWPTGWCAENA